MKKIKSMSIQKKLFILLLSFSILIVIFITGTAVKNTYDTMKEQLIYNRQMSIGWLKDRLELELSKYQDQFYEFEVDQKLKSVIENWCLYGNEMYYTERQSLINRMNEAISMDSDLNSIEIYNLIEGEVLIAERSGASSKETGDRLDFWEQRDDSLQSNLVFMRTEKEILVMHEMLRFTDKKPYALIVMHLRPYSLQDILEDIKMTDDESVIILNDEKVQIEADYGELSPGDFETVGEITGHMEESSKSELFSDGNFWFYREVGKGKLTVILSVPDHVIVSALKGTILAAILAGAIMIVVCIICSIIFSRVFSGPIIRLSKIMRNFTLNNSNDAIEMSAEVSLNNEKPTENEIMILQESFDIMVDRNQKLIAQEYQLELEKRKAQVHALQAQINPHFMYNILQVIGGMALDAEAPQIYTVTNALSDIMRYCLNFSREWVPLREEIHYLQSYCMLQNERFSDRIDLQVTVDEMALEQLIPKLILQPILENSFHHGLASKPGKWILAVKGEFIAAEDNHKEPMLVLTITDNGRGMTRERLHEIQANLKRDVKLALDSGEHIGLCNVDARLRLMYPETDYGVHIDSQEGEGTTVVIRMKAVNPSERGHDEKI